METTPIEEVPATALAEEAKGEDTPSDISNVQDGDKVSVTEASDKPDENVEVVNTPISESLAEEQKVVEPETHEEADKKAETKEAFAEESTKTAEDHQDADTDTHTQVSEAATEETVDTQIPKGDTNKYELIDYLNQFLLTDGELNDVLSGYYARLFNILLQKKSDEVGKYFYNNPRYLYKLAYHSYSKSITDTIIKILDISKEKLGMDDVKVDAIRVEFLKTLLGRLADNESINAAEYALNIFQIFYDLSYKKVYYGLLVEESVLNSLGEILVNGAPEQGSNAAIRIFNILISSLRDSLSTTNKQQKMSFMYGGDDEDDVLIQEDSENKTNEAEKINETIKTHSLVSFLKEKVIGYLVEQLDVIPQKNIIDFQYGDNIFVLGKRRLAIVNLMESIIDLRDEGLRVKVLETNFFKKVFELFLEFPLNNFLQLHFENILQKILKDDLIAMPVKIEVLKKTGILQILPSFWEDNQQFSFPSGREFRHGYLAFTTRISNTIRETAKLSTELLELTNEPEWKNFVEKDVDVYNEKNSIVLANRNRTDSNEVDHLDDHDDDEDRFDKLDTRDDLEDDDDKEDHYANRTSLRETLQKYDPNKATEDHEGDYVSNQIEVDESEDKLFSGLGRYEDDSSSDEDTPIPDVDEQAEKDNTSESSDYYDNSYWQISQYSIDDLLHP